jgi:acyl carrier protein
MRAQVLDGGLQIVPVGVKGELYLAGTGLARGYLADPKLTAEHFVPDPYGPPGTRMYRVGDLARWNAAGMLEFMGRVDRQVKIRGFRIELTEIEVLLEECRGVESAMVVVWEKERGEKQLVAYVKGKGGERVEVGRIRSVLRERLPGYMVPGVVEEVEEWPLTENGKVDRKKLPGWERRGKQQKRRARTPEEEMLCGMFAEVLGLEEVGIEEDFFQLGGHSLMATRLVSRIRGVFGVEVPLRSVFEGGTVEKLAEYVKRSPVVGGELKAGERPERVPLSYAQQRLWFIDRLEGRSTEYNIPLGLRLRGELNEEALERAVKTIVGRHESLRTHFEEEEGEAVQKIEREVRVGIVV